MDRQSAANVPSGTRAVSARVCNAFFHAASGAAATTLHHVRWTVSTLTTDAYLFGNLTFFGTSAVYVVFDLISGEGNAALKCDSHPMAPLHYDATEDAVSGDGVRDMLLIQSIVGILSAVAYMLVWYGGEPSAADLTAECLNVSSAVWYTLVVLLERFTEELGLNTDAVIGIEVAAAAFFLVEAVAYAVAWFQSVSIEGSILTRLFQWGEVYFWGHLLNIIPGKKYSATASPHCCFLPSSTSCYVPLQRSCMSPVQSSQLFRSSSRDS